MLPVSVTSAACTCVPLMVVAGEQSQLHWSELVLVRPLGCCVSFSMCDSKCSQWICRVGIPAGSLEDGLGYPAGSVEASLRRGGCSNEIKCKWFPEQLTVAVS